MSNPWDSDPVVKAAPADAAPWANDPAVGQQPSGYIDQMKQGIAEGVSGVGKTLDVHSSEGGKVNAVGKWLEKYGNSWAPTDFHPANLFDENGFHPGNIGLWLAHGAPATGAVIGAAGMAPEALGTAGAIGAGAGASYLMGAGNEAQEAADKRTGQPNSPVTGSDVLRGDLTAGAESAVGALPVTRYLKGAAGPLEATGAAGVARALKQLGITSADQAAASGGADVVHQLGQSVGTPGGVKVDPNEVANAAAGGAVMGPVFGAKGAVRESLDAMKYKELGTPELRQAATQVANRVQQNAGGQNLDGSVLFTGNSQKAGEQAVKKTGLDIQTELGNAVSALRQKTTLPVDADNVLNAALKGQRPTEDGYAQLAAAMGQDPNGANVMNLLHQQHAFDVLNNSGYHVGGKFKGGLGGFGSHILTGENVGKSALVGLGAAAFEEGAGHIIAFSPQVIGAALGIRALGRMADNLTGAQSPAGRFVRNFADGSTPVRLDVPQAPAPAAPVVSRPGPTGPRVPPAPTPWGAEPPEAAPAVYPLGLPAHVTGPARTLMRGAALAQKMREAAQPVAHAPEAVNPNDLPSAITGPGKNIMRGAAAVQKMREAAAPAAAEPEQALNPMALPASITGPAKNIMRGAKLRANALGEAEAQNEIAQSPYIDQKLNGQPMPSPAAARFMRQGMGSANTLARIQSDPQAEAEAADEAKAVQAEGKRSSRLAEYAEKQRAKAEAMLPIMESRAKAAAAKLEAAKMRKQEKDDKAELAKRKAEAKATKAPVPEKAAETPKPAPEQPKPQATKSTYQGAVKQQQSDKQIKDMGDMITDLARKARITEGALDGKARLVSQEQPTERSAPRGQFQLVEPAPQTTKVVKGNGTTQRNDELFPPSSYGHLPSNEASKQVLKETQASGKFVRDPEKYRASTQARIDLERIAVAAIRHQHPNLPSDLAARLEATRSQAAAALFREHYKAQYPEAAAAFDKHLSDEKIAALWTKKRK